MGTHKKPKMVRFDKDVAENFKQRYVKLFKKFVDIFSWSCEDMKTYDTSIIQHKIPLKPRVKYYRQKLRQINPLFLPSIEKEVKKVLQEKIVVPLRYSDWVANLVPVRNKNG